MAIEYRFEKLGDILVVETRGYDEGLDAALEYNRVVAERAKQLGCEKILAIEKDMEYRLSIVDTYKLADQLSKFALSFKKIAVVTNEENKDAAQFWEDVANNRGVFVRVFYSLEDAKAWLER